MGFDRMLDEPIPGMDSSRGDRQNRSQGRVGLTLLGLVVALLAGGFLLNLQLRPSVGIEPASPASATTGVTTAGPGHSEAVVGAAAASTAKAAALAPTPEASLSQPQPLVADSPLGREIEAAYLRYWDVRADALLNLDTSRLSEVMAGAELKREREQIAELKSQGRAARIAVEHCIVFLKVSGSKAELYDEYLNRSHLVSMETKQPIQQPGPGGVAKVLYRLEKTDGVWRVVDGTRHD